MRTTKLAFVYYSPSETSTPSQRRSPSEPRMRVLRFTSVVQPELAQTESIDSNQAWRTARN